MIPLLLVHALLATVALEPCRLETRGVGRIAAQCGSIMVRDDEDGREVPVGFAILEATDRKKHPDPIVIVPGGPGQAATDLAAFIGLALADLRRERDLVLFDPRGTGRSGKLTCGDLRDPAKRIGASEEEEQAFLASCAKTLSSAVNPRTITTARIAQDLDAVREALRVEQWNVLGVSYGTRVAMAYDRAFPGRARTLVLDAVVPLSMRIGDHIAEGALSALEALHARSPMPRGGRSTSLVDITRTMRRSLDEAPREVSYADPVTAAPRTVRLDGRAALRIVLQLLYTEETAALLPPLLRAAAANDLSPLAAQAHLAATQESSLSRPMYFSVVCAEDLPQTPTQTTESDNPFADLMDLRPACAVWPHGESPVSVHDLLPASSTPALLLSGSADPVTPPATAERARQTLPRSVHVVGEGLGHGLLARSCVPSLLRRFVNSGTSEGLDTSCTKKLAPFPSLLDAMGPPP